MLDIAAELKNLAFQSRGLIESAVKDHNTIYAWIAEYTKTAKAALDNCVPRNVETPVRSPNQVENHTFVVEVQETPEPKQASPPPVHNIEVDEKPKSLENLLVSYETPVRSAKKTPAHARHVAMHILSKVSNNSCSHSTPRKILAATKASKHRLSTNRSVLSSCTEVARQSRVLRPNRKKPDHEEAMAKKNAILKSKVEEQKRKREIKAQRNYQARQQIEREKENRLRMHELNKGEKMASSEKETEKHKGKDLQTKKRQATSSDDCQINKESAGKNEKCLAVDSATCGSSTIVVPDVAKSPEAAKSQYDTPKVCNVTYISEDKENSENYSMTPQNPHCSYSNYEISELRPSDESDEDTAPSKPVPAWARGIRLKEALIKQFYNPPDLAILFPEIEIAIDENFGMWKRRKIQRSSSAVWATPVRPFAVH